MLLTEEAQPFELPAVYLTDRQIAAVQAAIVESGASDLEEFARGALLLLAADVTR